MHHIPEEHVTFEIPMVLVYATKVLTFTISAVAKIPYEVDRYEILGKDIQSNEEGLITAFHKNL